MQCWTCAQQGVSTSGRGICAVCSMSACAWPSLRPDKAFHGARCKCGCRKFVCEIDIAEHARTTHRRGKPTTCFPSLALGTAVTALHAAMDLTRAARGEPYDAASVARANVFLNGVAPGRTVLVEGRDQVSADFYDLIELAGPIMRPALWMRPEFFSAVTVERLGALAARTTATALDEFGVSKTALRLLGATRLSTLRLIVTRFGETHEWPHVVRAVPTVAEVWLVSFLRQWLPSARFVESLPPAPSLDPTALFRWLSGAAAPRPGERERP